MKFGKYLEDKLRPEWRDFYLDYKSLKDLIKSSSQLTAQSAEGAVAYSPRTTSLTVTRNRNTTEAAEEKFFLKLEAEVKKISGFTDRLVTELRKNLKNLNDQVDKATDEAEKEKLMVEAKRIGDEFLALEKYVNLNYLGFHKILKKHDKAIPHAPCRQFYVAHLHQQPWVQGNYSDLLVQLSNVYSKLRGDTSGQKNEDSAQGFVRSTTKYWVRNEDVSAVKHHVLQHLPVFQFDKNNFSGDAQLINSVYLDNSNFELYHGRLDKRPGAIALRLRWYGPEDPQLVFVERKTHRESWKGEESVKERFTLAEDKVVPFLEGEHTLEQAVADLRARGKSEREIQKFTELFTEVQQQLDSKQLKPLVRTQYMRTAFQIPFDATVRVSLDTNLCMIKENPDDGPSCTLAGRWYRDPALPINRSEITRFPHAVLEVKLSLPEGESAPAWVQELLDSGYLTEVHKFSKFIHGCCTLFPDMVQAVPYWVDDESVRPSMLMSAAGPTQPPSSVAISIPNGHAADEEASSSRGREIRRTLSTRSSLPRKRQPEDDELRHPLLGDEPSLRLLPDRSEIAGLQPGGRRSGGGGGGGGHWSIIDRIYDAFKPKEQTHIARAIPMRLEPKTFFANERTFLAWLHMSVTIGSIAAAMLGFAGTTPDSGASALSVHLVELIALILLPVAVMMCGYALLTFMWRARLIARKQIGHFDDRVGPIGLCATVVAALSAIAIISIVDFAELLADRA